MSGVKDRILQFIKFEKLTTVEFEKSIGVSNGYVTSISRSIQPDKLGIISDVYPQLNIEWLLIGKGSMLKAGQSSTVQQSGRSANYQGTFTEPINTVIGSGNITGSEDKISYAQQKRAAMLGRTPSNETAELRHENERLKNEVERFKMEIEHLKMTIELQKSFIEEKERMIKILLEKK